MYKGVIYGKEKHIFYLDAPGDEFAWNWLHDKCEEMNVPEGSEINLDETDEVFSDYVPFVENNGKIRQIWFDSHEEAQAFSEHIASKALYGKIEPIDIVPEMPYLVRGRGR